MRRVIMTKKGYFILVIVLLSMSFYGCDNKYGDTVSKEPEGTVTLSPVKEEVIKDEKIDTNNAIRNTILKEDPLENIKLDKKTITNDKRIVDKRYSEIVDIDVLKNFITDNPKYHDKQVLIPIESVEQQGQLVIKNVDLETGQYEKILFSGKKNDFKDVKVLHSDVRKWNFVSSRYGEIWLINIEDKECYQVNRKKIYNSYLSNQGILYVYNQEDNQENSGIYFLNFNTLEEQSLIKTTYPRDIYEYGNYLYIATFEGIIYEYNMQTGNLVEVYSVTEQDDQVSINNIMCFQDDNLYLSIFNYDEDVNQLLIVNKDGEWIAHSSKTNFGSDYFSLNNTSFFINSRWGKIQIFQFDKDYSMELLKHMYIDVINYFVYNDYLYLVEECGQVLKLNHQFEIERIISPVALRDNPVESHKYNGANKNILHHENKLIVHSSYDGVYSPLTREYIDGTEKTFSRDYPKEKDFKLPNENVRVLEENNRFISIDERNEISELIDEFYLDMTYNDELIVYSTHEGQLIRMNRRINLKLW